MAWLDRVIYYLVQAVLNLLQQEHDLEKLNDLNILGQPCMLNSFPVVSPGAVNADVSMLERAEGPWTSSVQRVISIL